MSTEINKAFVQQFSNNLIILSQQRGSKLAGTVMRKDVTGKYAHFDRLGATVATLRTSRHGDTPLTDTPHSRRRVTLSDYEVADLIDSQDEVRMLIDPKSSYAQAMGYALGRTMDDLIIDAADGNASAIDSADAASNVAVAHTIDEDFNTANSDIIVEKVIEAKRILMSNEVQADEDLYFVLDATALGNMLGQNEVQSADYNSVKALVRGELNTFMGFTFVQSERINDSGEGNFKNCLAYAKSGIGLAVGQDIKVKMSERDDKSYATQVYASMTGGAVRVEEEKVIVVEAYRA
jgi:hypothetical protein